MSKGRRYVALMATQKIYYYNPKSEIGKKTNMSHIRRCESKDIEQLKKWIGVETSEVLSEEELQADTQRLIDERLARRRELRKIHKEKVFKNILKNEYGPIIKSKEPDERIIMHREISPRRVTLEMLKGLPKGLIAHYTHGGNNKYFGTFSGKVVSISDEQILLEDMTISFSVNEQNFTDTIKYFRTEFGSVFSGIPMRIGDTISFKALSYVEQHIDGSITIGLKQPYQIRKSRENYDDLKI